MEQRGPSRQQEDQQPVAKRPCSRQDEEVADEEEMAGLELLAAAGAVEGDAAREFVLTSEHLLTAIFGHLCLEDLCRAAMVRARWREVTSNPNFWRTISLKGRTLQVSKVCHLLSQHSGVQYLNARGVAFTANSLVTLLPRLTRLESLELEKGAYDRQELDALSSNLPALRRLVLAGGLVGSPMHEWSVLSHGGLQELVLEAGRAVRLTIRAHQLTSLSLRDFTAGTMQLEEAGALAALSVADCPKLTDGALRALLCLEGNAAGPLPSLTSLSLSCVPNASDETLRQAGQRHVTIASLSLASCGALTGAGLGQNGAFPALRRLSLEFCDSVTGAHLSDSANDLHELEELWVAGCAQVTALRLRSHRLGRLVLSGTRALQELELRCALLEEVDIRPLNPGLAASLALKRITLSSHAVERLQWSAFPALESVRLQCPNLRELDLSECRSLADSVWESLGSGPGGYAGGAFTPGCPQLRALKLGDCESLRSAELHSQTLESLQLSCCRRLAGVRLNCPQLRALALEECTYLEAVQLRSRHMTAMSLGTCPRLGAIAIECEAMEELDLRGCNQLASLQLGCPALRAVDATFCSSLSDAAIEALARCQALEALVLAVCNSVTVGGLAALGCLSRLRTLDLSYTPLEDPTTLYAACPQLTALTLSNNYMLRPEALLPLLDCRDWGAAAAAHGQAAGRQLEAPAASTSAQSQAPAPLLPHLRELDISYCSMPEGVLAAVVTRASRLHSLSINGCRGGVTDALWPLLHSRADATTAAGAGSVAASAAGLPSQEAPAVLLASPDFRGCAPEPAGPATSDFGPAADPAPAVAGALPPSPALQQTACPPHQLRSLSMVGSKEMRCFWLGLAPAAAALSHGLLIAGGAAATEGGQQWVPVATPLAGLQELRMSLSGRLRSLALGLPQLTDLQLNNCGALSQLVLHCPSLQRLSMQACKAVREPALVALVACCPQLQELDLQYCPQVTPEVVAMLHSACPSLQTVHVTPIRAATP